MIQKISNSIYDGIYENIIGELEAIQLYNKAIRNISDPYVICVLKSIRDEEKVHLGELFGILLKVDPDQANALREGFKEIDEIIDGTKFECYKRSRNIKRNLKI